MSAMSLKRELSFPPSSPSHMPTNLTTVADGLRYCARNVAALLQSRPSISARMRMICECSFQFYMARGNMPCPKSFAAASYFAWV